MSRLTSPTRLGLVGLALVLVLSTSAGVVALDRALQTHRDGTLGNAYLIATAADLRRDRDALKVAVDSMVLEIRLVDALISYAADREAMGTGRAIRALMEVREPVSVHLSADTYADLRLTGRGELIPFPRIRESLVRYYDVADGIDGSGGPLFASYLVFLDAQLSRGGWSHFQDLPRDDSDAVEFGPILDRLKKAGLETQLRGLRRGMTTHHDRLRELQAQNDSLIARIEEALGVALPTAVDDPAT